MDSSSNPYMSEQEDTDMGEENIAESPRSAIDSCLVTSSTSSPKRRRGIEKRVVQIPMKEVEGSQSNKTPPSDSWAWRKYGQKPIKGSPYPRGYYRCSSSKGCPARKQVERSRADPTMLLVTYSSHHNHPSPPSRDNHTKSNKKPDPQVSFDPKPQPDQRFPDLATADELGWFGQMEATATASSYALLESPIFVGHEADVASVFLPIGEEEESLFADLGELPECSVVFRRGVLLGLGEMCVRDHQLRQ